MCDKCQNIHAAWTPVCGNCGSFDTLSWKTPSSGEVAMPAGVEMLPLIVGQIADQSDETTEDTIDAEVIDADPVDEN